MQRRLFLQTAAGLFALASQGELLAKPLEPLALPPPDELVVSFGVVTDIHYANRGNTGHAVKGNVRAFRQSLTKLRAAVDLFNAKKLPFAIELGDFIDRRKSDGQEQCIAYLQEAEAEFSRFHGARYHVPGNHDFAALTLADYLDVTQNAGAANGRNWYGFHTNGLHFIALDLNYNNRQGDHYAPGRYDWNRCWVPDEELAWLKNELASSAEPVVVFTHQLINGQDVGRMCPSKEFARNAMEVVTLLEQSQKVLSVFSGHWHRGGYAVHNGIAYVVCHALILGTLPQNSFCVVHIDRAGNTYVEGFFDQPSYGKPIAQA